MILWLLIKEKEALLLSQTEIKADWSSAQLAILCLFPRESGSSNLPFCQDVLPNPFCESILEKEKQADFSSFPFKKKIKNSHKYDIMKCFIIPVHKKGGMEVGARKNWVFYRKMLGGGVMVGGSSYSSRVVV